MNKFVEYGADNIGRVYLVEKPGEIATVTPMDGTYNIMRCLYLTDCLRMLI